MAGPEKSGPAVSFWGHESGMLCSRKIIRFAGAETITIGTKFCRYGG